MKPTHNPTDAQDEWEALVTRRDEVARGRLVERYIGLVKYVAGRLAVGLPHYLEFTDLYSAGLLGLIQAIDNFDPSRGIKFETYAIPRIRGAILDELRAQDWFPRSLRRKARQLESAYGTLEAKFGRPASDDEIAEFLGVPVQDLDRMMGEVAVATMVSLDSKLHPEDGGDGERVVDTLVDERAPSAEDQLHDREMREVVVEVLKDLSDRERLVLTLYYYEELTLKEIGEVLSVTESRICQIHTKAIFRLRGKVQRRLEGKPLVRLGEEVAAALHRPHGVEA